MAAAATMAAWHSCSHCWRHQALLRCSSSDWVQHQWLRGFRRWKNEQNHEQEVEKRLRKQEKKQKRAVIRQALNSFIESGTESRIKGIKWRPDPGQKKVFERGEEAFDDGEQPWTSKRRAKAGKWKAGASEEGGRARAGSRGPEEDDEDTEEDPWDDWGHGHGRTDAGYYGKRRSRASSRQQHNWESYFAYQQQHPWSQFEFTRDPQGRWGRSSTSWETHQQAHRHQHFSEKNHHDRQHQHQQQYHSQFSSPSSAAGKHLQVLGLPMHCPLEEKTLKTAFLQRAKDWHPDRHSGPAKALAEAKFKDIQAAYQALRDLAGLSG